MKKSLSVMILRQGLSFVAELWISSPDHHFSGFGVCAPTKRLDGRWSESFECVQSMIG
jgi:hypothetical protein